MKITGVLLVSYLSSIYAAPAVVWQRRTAESSSSSPLVTSHSLRASDLLSELLVQDEDSSSLASVVFLLGRSDDGSESLSRLASSGALPQTESKYDNANAIHHNVAGIESVQTVVRDAEKANPDRKVMSVSLDELSKKLRSSAGVTAAEMEVSHNGKIISKTEKMAKKRSHALDSADVLIVKVDPPKGDARAKNLDATIAAAVESSLVENVVLASIRSTDEVKHERKLSMQQHRRRMVQANRSKENRRTARRAQSIFLGDNEHRRLEDEQQNNQNNNQNQNKNNNEDFSGVYYVSMTPNILSGILFFALFTVTTWIGITCMGMIQGQDVYVKKMPDIGREA